MWRTAAWRILDAAFVLAVPLLLGTLALVVWPEIAPVRGGFVSMRWIDPDAGGVGLVAERGSAAIWLVPGKAAGPVLYNCWGDFEANAAWPVTIRAPHRNGVTYLFVQFSTVWSFALTATIVLAWIVAWCRDRRDARRASRNRCVTCGYDLRGSSTACPECGHAISATPAACPQIIAAPTGSGGASASSPFFARDSAHAFSGTSSSFGRM